MILEWSPAMLIGDEILDNQHKLIFELVNIVAGEENESDFRTNFLELFKGISMHSHYEEELMKEIKYPDYRQHIEDHFTLTNTLNLIRVQIDNNSLDLQYFREFVKTWAYGHIQGDDASLVAYLNDYRSLQE